MALITSKYFVNDTANYNGLITNHGSVNLAYVNFANIENYSNNITKNSISSISVRSSGLFLIKAPIHFDSTSTSFTLFYDIEINGNATQFFSVAPNWSFTPSYTYTYNSVLNLNFGDTIRFRTRTSAAVANHTNGICFTQNKSDANFLISRL